MPHYDGPAFLRNSGQPEAPGPETQHSAHYTLPPQTTRKQPPKPVSRDPLAVMHTPDSLGPKVRSVIDYPRVLAALTRPDAAVYLLEATVAADLTAPTYLGVALNQTATVQSGKDTPLPKDGRRSSRPPVPPRQN